MKKKGLIIATIVMVLVLAVSLTTATYAWFTVSNVTTIDAFTVEVVPNNAVAIGVKANNTYEANGATDPTMYLNGTVAYSDQTPGTIGGGKWTGDQQGLGANITHGIKWGSQKKAVGITSADSVAEAAYNNTTTWTKTGLAVAANGKEGVSDGTLLDTPVAARANVGATAEEGGDYAYLFLGVKATQELETNQLIILLDTADSQYVGILSAVHVAYRINGGTEGAWVDKDMFTTAHYNNKVTDDAALNPLDDNQKNSYLASYTGKTTPAAAAAVVIDLSQLAVSPTGNIVQVEIVIYIAGADSDCITGALGSNGNISIFFHTVAKTQNNG